MNTKLKFLISFVFVFSAVILAVCFVSIVLNKNGEVTPSSCLYDSGSSCDFSGYDESASVFNENSSEENSVSSSQKPESSSQRPVSSSQRPESSSQKSESSSQRPESSSQKPESSSQRPESSSQKPESSSQKPESSSSVPEVKDDYRCIMGKNVLSAEQMVSYVIKKLGGSISDIKLTCSLYELASYYLDEGEKEGVRGDIAFMQAIVETGWFTYPSSGSVTYEQNNFCGLGVTGEIDPATGKKVKGECFENARIGVRAQIQHLKGYAVSDDLLNACVDNRYKYIYPRGRAGNLWEGLNMLWSMTSDYSVKILAKYTEAKELPVNSGYVALSKTKNPK